MMYYAAGGAVRDMLLGREMRDADYVFDAPEETFIQRNPSARKTQSACRRIYLLRGQEFTPLGENEDALHANLAERDLTVNSLLLSADGVLHTHPNALTDLRERILRPASRTAFADDPVRVFRTARFAAQFPDFYLHESCLDQMRALPESALAAVAAEQIGKECLKACAAERPGNFLRALRDGACFSPWLCEFVGADDVVAGPSAYHKGSVLEHTAEIMDLAATGASTLAPEERALAVWMALCHDIGKCATPVEILPHHYGHEETGAAMARSLGLRLRLPKRWIKAGELAARLHMKGGRYASLRPGTKVDLLMQAHSARLFRPFIHLVAADAKESELPERMDRDRELILSVPLPPEWRGKHEASGSRLRELRCLALCGKH